MSFIGILYTFNLIIMNVFTSYLLQNWGMILILIAFAITLKVTVFLDKKTVIRMYSLMIAIFLLSITVFTEFYLADLGEYKDVRVVMAAIRYSATPLIISLILFALVKKAKWYVFIPAILLTILNIISIFTGIVFSIDDAGTLQRGVLGYFPYIWVGIYGVLLVVILILQSNKQTTEIIPIVFLAFSLASGVIFPFVVGKDYSKIFCTIIAIALFVYYVFLILQLTKKDSLTGLLNRQAYYATIRESAKDITAFISIDMNGLKAINDSEGHLAGDEALKTLANCFVAAASSKQLVFRIGGDEFVIVCRKTGEDELVNLIDDIKLNVSMTKYSCSVGYSYSPAGTKDLEEMVKESDKMMYADKASYYSKAGKNRRHN